MNILGTTHLQLTEGGSQERCRMSERCLAVGRLNTCDTDVPTVGVVLFMSIANKSYKLYF